MTNPTKISGPLRVGLVVVGLLTAASAGALALFTVGERYAAVTAAAIAIASIIIAFSATPLLGRFVMALLIVTLAGTLLTGAYGTIQIIAAVAGSTTGQVDAPDAATLESAERKLDQSVEDTTFLVELTESELNAVLLDSLAETDTPFQRITVDILNSVGETPLIEFVGDFKNGRLTVDGRLTANTEGGRFNLELLEADVGMFTMPGIARDAVEDMIARVADLNRALAEEGADVQSVVIGDDSIVVTGVATGEGVIDAGVLLAGFGDLSGIQVPSIDVTPFEPGVDSDSAGGESFYVALGDSLAAAVGIDGYADGYVSQVHRELSVRDGTVYGLRNFGGSGETSGTMLIGGQLDAALAFADKHEVAYVTIDIGANDLLGHLASSDCSDDGSSPECTSRIEASLDAYASNMELILDAISDKMPDATVVFLATYNPFSFGFEDEVAFESMSNEVLARLNEIAVGASTERGFLVADGFTPMRGVATATTHMTDTPPDIHPNEVGYDILTGAILDALS